MGYTNPTDLIYANSYPTDRSIKIADGQTLFDEYGNGYSGSLSSPVQLLNISGRTLRPITITYSYTLTANAHDGNYWTTFYSSEAGYKINYDENAYAYTATYSSETLTLHKLGKVIPAGTAVIIVGADNEIGLTASSEEAEYTVSNHLRGVDERTACADISTTGTFYVMGKVNGNFGFFQYTADYMPARKAYLLVSNGAALVNGFRMEFEDDATGIQTLSNSPLKGEDIYNLAGQRLNKMQKGINIVNGKKIIIK